MLRTVHCLRKSFYNLVSLAYCYFLFFFYFGWQNKKYKEVTTAITYILNQVGNSSNKLRGAEERTAHLVRSYKIQILRCVLSLRKVWYKQCCVVFGLFFPPGDCRFCFFFSCSCSYHRFACLFCRWSRSHGTSLWYRKESSSLIRHCKAISISGVRTGK